MRGMFQRTIVKYVLATATLVLLTVGCKNETQRPLSAPTESAAPADVAAPPSDAVKTASGLATKVLRVGSGKERPTAASRVTVHYTGWTTDGKSFDSSDARTAIYFWGFTGHPSGRRVFS